MEQKTKSYWCNTNTPLVSVAMKFTILLLCLSGSCSVDVQYRTKIISGIRNDMFGVSIGAHHQTLVIGAPYDPYDSDTGGAVTVQQGGKTPYQTEKIRGPPHVSGFGWNVAVNQHFIVACSLFEGFDKPVHVYVHSAEAPYVLKATLTLNAGMYVSSLAISDDNTIAVAQTLDEPSHDIVHVFNYGRNNTWHLASKMDFDTNFGQEVPIPKVTIWGNNLAAGIPGAYNRTGRLYLYKRHGDHWMQTQTLAPRKDVLFFGDSIMMGEHRLVVSSRVQDGSKSVVFVYNLDPFTGTWRADGNIVPPGTPDFGFKPPRVDISNDMIFVSVSDSKRYPEVTSVVYKRMEGARHSTWREYATLKTKGEPLTGIQHNWVVCVENKHVYTGRIDMDHHGMGAVYVHDLPR